MSLSIIVTEHAVKKYKERVTEDPERGLRTDEEIKEMIAGSLEKYRGYDIICKLANVGPGLKVKVKIAFGENGYQTANKYDLVVRNGFFRKDRLLVITIED